MIKHVQAECEKHGPMNFTLQDNGYYFCDMCWNETGIALGKSFDEIRKETNFVKYWFIENI